MKNIVLVFAALACLASSAMAGQRHKLGPRHHGDVYEAPGSSDTVLGFIVIRRGAEFYDPEKRRLFEKGGSYNFSNEEWN